ncbi:hypothetical protein ABB37_07488 [Leptomonas pyrrhocoris]|uniref:Uncharacterized protein n=1 Tax=Leptomonas pyrrhocoris TaxID=157538 RepID=A0A0N0VDV4_LEPPY|nr:hypothetical protein ABB37_07488 [Leptomonas pyrrhocoris]XP_015655068.1 hypothetical protein ABB37_07488 [Leptomonas pyrrhocoris]KPA76628.1 hypothetical protein ABB37_07488 [Leptomonas pyrrhocoris]KPA76629.1 hypothetical protein ABB37_07488 [Leptomonas pyrrhocoris]|eukprot:XP_015655067.1 hypothetical protein ABB37_07488 [Leptomonas pyrrhocoris]
MTAKPEQSVASELVVNDRTLVVPAPPLSLTNSGDLVWVALSDGKVEVRNARTGEVVRRFEPALATTKADGTGAAAGGAAPPNSASALVNASSVVGLLSNLTNRVLAGSQTLPGSGASALKKQSEESPVRVVVQVRYLLAVPIADCSTHVWLGLSNGAIEVHEGGDLLHSSVGAVSTSSSGGFLAVLRKHTAAVTCLAEFGGYVYSGSEDQRIVQWRAAHSSFVSLFTSQSPHQAAVRCLYAEGNAVVSGSDDCTVKVWDVGEGTMRLTGYFHSRSGGVLSLCRVGELMWSGDASGQVVRWHIRTCEAVALHRPHRDRVLSLCHVGDRVYSGSADGTMGIFDAATGQLRQQITDQALGWVTTVACPAELSRFVVWSTSADGAVRCWYQDEYVGMTADEFRFNDPSWYECGSTPYREFRAAVGQRTSRLKRQLEAIEQRDQQTMAVLRRCSTVFGGGGADFAEQQRRLQEQLAKAEERCSAAEARLAQRREVVSLHDRDIAATLQLIQAAKNELNTFMPGEAERILATLPAVKAEDVVPYSQSQPPSSSTGAAPPSQAPMTTAAGLSTYAAGTAVPSWPPPTLAPLPTTTTTAPLPPPAATTSTLGVGGPLSTAPPPPPPPAPVPVVPAVSPPGVDAATVTHPPPPPPPPPPATAATTTTAPPAAASPPLPAQSSKLSPAAGVATVPVDDGLNWTNPHVGNYIQRRYYGASPSLRTIDLMKQERRRGRLPRVKVEPLQRGRSHSATSAATAKSRTSSVKEREHVAAATTPKTSTTTTTTTVVTTSAQPAPAK